MIRRSTVIISIAVIAALAAGIAVMTLWTDSASGPHTPSPSPPVTGDLFRETAENVSSIYFRPLGGTPYTLTRDPSDGDVALDAAGILFPGRSSAVRIAFSSAIGLGGLTRITEEADDAQLALFGLDEPVMTWRVNRADGTSVELMAGSTLATGPGRYARRQGSREVFLLSTLQSTNLTRSLEDLYDLSFFPPSPGETPAWETIGHLILETGGHVIEIRRRTGEEMAEAELGVSVYQIIQPFIGEGSDSIQPVLFEPVSRIVPGSVEEAFPSDLSVYGLDSPDRLTVTAGEWTGTLLIGRRDFERGGRYVMIEGVDAVLFDADNENYTFINIDPSQLRSGVIWLHNIVDISSVTFELEGVPRVLKLEHDAEDNGLQGWLDGIDIGENNARRLYRAAISLTQNGIAAAGIPDEPPVYRITLHFLDGGEETVGLYRISDSEFLIVHNGVSTGLFTTRMALQQSLLSRFEMLDRGEELPRF